VPLLPELIISPVGASSKVIAALEILVSCKNPSNVFVGFSISLSTKYPVHIFELPPSEACEMSVISILILGISPFLTFIRSSLTPSIAD